MFQNLTSYFLGGTTTTSTGLAGGVNNDDDRSTRVALRTTDHDDGWTMVDRDSEGNSDEFSSEEEDNVSDSRLEHVHLRRTESNDSLTRVHAHDMEESWFVTPPPCFSSQTGSVQLRTSPLENLLIEHPSMSVYQRTGSRFTHLSSPTPSETSEDAEEPDELQTRIVTRKEERLVVINVIEHRHVAHKRDEYDYVITEIAHKKKGKMDMRPFVRHRQAQKVQMKKLAEQSQRGHLIRANKAREVNGRNWNPRRKERSQGSNRSHANNNRKC